MSGFSTKNLSLGHILSNTVFKESVINRNNAIIDRVSTIKVSGFVDEDQTEYTENGCFCVNKTQNFEFENVVIVENGFVQKLSLKVGEHVFHSKNGVFYKITQSGWFISGQKPSLGDIKMSFASSDHDGWFLCDGRSLKKSDYQDFWNVYKNYINENLYTKVSTYVSGDFFFLPSATLSLSKKSGSSTDFLGSRFFGFGIFVFVGK